MAVKMAWYSHLFKNFLQFVVIHIVKSFNVVNEANIDVFLEFPCSFYDPTAVDDLMSGFSTFFKPVVYLEVLASCTVEAQLEGF